MLHVVLGIYILSFAGGVTLIVVSVLASRRLVVRGLLDFAFLFTASTLILVVEALKTYERAAGADFGPGLHVSAIVLSVIGNGGMTWYLLVLSLEVVGTALSRRLFVLVGCLAVLVAALGGLKEAVPLVAAGPYAETILGNLDYIVLLAVHVCAGVILLARFARIEPLRLRAIVRAFLIYLGAFSVLSVGQLVAQNLRSSPPFFREVPVEEIVYYLGFVVVALVLLARYFTEPMQSPAADLPQEFLQRFRISPREREIIEMMAQGFSNGAIAEKLFISTVTVKNHIYHIYQKTGAGNRIQLLNLMNSSK